MHLSPQEKDKLLIVTAALLAERRLNRGLKLNHPEAVAWLSFLVLEGARDGKSVAELMQDGTTWLRQDQVMEGVPELVHEVQIEAVFPDGTIDTIAGRGATGFDGDTEASEGASLRSPRDVVYAPDGDVVFADTENAVVRRIDQPTW